MSAVTASPAVGHRPKPSTRVQRLLHSSIGLKLVMAITGLILSGFILGHMLGNLQAYQGAEAIDAYGKLLHKEPAILWTVRLTLIGSVGLHIWAFVTLTLKNRKARPVAYQNRKFKESTYASRSMKLTGPLILAFLVYHILHLTTGTVHPDYREGEVFHNLATGLNGISGLIYIVAMIMLAFHLWHGVWSLFQTLGLPEERYGSLGRRFATIFTVLVTLGFISIPVAILTGFLHK